MDSSVAEFVPFETLCSGADAHAQVLARTPSKLDEPLAHAPLVLAQEHGSELGETIGRIVEAAEDLLALSDRQRESGAAGL